LQRMEVNREYLQKLLEPFKSKHTITVFRPPESLTVTFEAKPKIVRGHYLLYIEWTIKGEEANFNERSYSCFPPFGVCPHLTVKNFEDVSFVNAGYLAINQPQIPRKGRC